MNTVRLLALLGMFVLANTATLAVASPYEGSIDHKQDSNWRKVVDSAAKRSALQNHGHADFIHTCYAQDKEAFCADTITYRDRAGIVTFVRVIRRGIDNSFYARDICKFNDPDTSRTCIDFDNGYKSYWVKDKNDDWILINHDDDDASSGGL